MARREEGRVEGSEACRKSAILILELRTYGTKPVLSCFSMKSSNQFAENVHLSANSYKIK